MLKYELTFTEAMQVLINKEGWVQGEDFSTGVVLMFDSGSVGKDYIHVHDFTLDYFDCKWALQITRGTLSQKYRVVSTQPDAERKIK
jgi:hypothetical protein